MFTTSVPATAEAFFDREAERAQVLEAIEGLRRGAPRWLCLIGARKVGKTSLLLEVARQVHERPARSRPHPPHFVVLDVLETLPLSFEVFRTLAFRALDATLSVEAGTSLCALARDPAGYRKALVASPSFAKLPTGAQGFALELATCPVDGAGFVRDCLELPELLAGATGRLLVIAIDELQELASLASGRKGTDPLPLMRSVWQRHKRVGYVVSGSSRSMLLRLATSQCSPFFQHFKVVPIGEFSEKAAVELLVSASASQGPIGEALAREVFRAVGGNPFYLQILGEALCEHRAAGGKASDQRRLKECLQQELFSRTGRLSLYFENEFQRLVGRATTLAATLDRLAEGPVRLADLARSIKAPAGATLGYLERLGDAVERRERGLHALVDSLFGLWLRWRRPGGSVVPMKILGDEGEAAAAEHLARHGFDLVYQSRGSRGAFDLLATRGATQLAVQVKRSPMPLRFGAAEWRRMEADSTRFGWRWAVASVEGTGRVVLLDPSRARRTGTSVTLGAAAEIENVLAWLDA